MPYNLKDYIDGKIPSSRTINSKPLSADMSLTKSDVGLGNLDNTSDANKPVSTAQATAIGLKMNTVTLAPVATSGAYSDLSGKPTIPSVTRTTSTLTLSLVGSGAVGTQISSTKDATIRVNLSASNTSSIGGPGTSLITLKKCSTNNATEGSWTSVAILENDQTITLALALNSVQTIKAQLSCDVPAGWYVKLVNSGTGTHSEAFISGEQTIYG